MSPRHAFAVEIGLLTELISPLGFPSRRHMERTPEPTTQPRRKTAEPIECTGSSSTHMRQLPEKFKIM